MNILLKKIDHKRQGALTQSLNYYQSEALICSSNSELVKEPVNWLKKQIKANKKKEKSPTQIEHVIFNYLFKFSFPDGRTEAERGPITGGMSIYICHHNFGLNLSIGQFHSSCVAGICM